MSEPTATPAALDQGEGFTLVGDQTRALQYLQVIHALALEVNTGMNFSSRGSVMEVGRRLTGSRKRTKRGVLADVVAYVQANVWTAYKPTGSVAKALIG